MRERIVVALRKILRNSIYRSRHGLAKGLLRKGGLGFIPEIFVPPTFEDIFLRSLALTGHTIYDVGGYEGVFTMFFARAAGKNGKVITFEPSLSNLNKIRDNIELNDFNNIELINVGLGSKKDTLTLSFSDYEMGKGSIDESIKNEILKQKGAKTIQVEIYPLDEYIKLAGLPKPSLVKIDVEGMELDVINGMSATIGLHKPKLFIEIHGLDRESKTVNARAVVSALRQKKYSIYHVESKQMITDDNAEQAMIGRIYCE